jgi:hypothetical protein
MISSNGAVQLSKCCSGSVEEGTSAVGLVGRPWASPASSSDPYFSFPTLPNTPSLTRLPQTLV